jgi:acyl CoA:acetate/3-ketoacid CoA transferase beta subunit
VIEITPQGLQVLELAEGLSLDELQALSGVPLRMA